MRGGGRSSAHGAESSEAVVAPATLAAPAPPPLLFAPTITATKTDSIPNATAVNPGATITYTVTISNGGPDPATGVMFNDSVDTNTTLVPGSVQTQPVSSPDTFNVIGNVRIQVPDGTGDLLANDLDPDTGNNTGLTVTALAGDSSAPFAGTSTQGGNVTATTGDGSFQYNPAPGFTGTDTFTYTVSDGTTTDTQTVTLRVGNGTATPGTNVIWFVDPSAPAGGDGRLTNPFNCYTGATASCFSQTAADDAGDTIFLYSGAHTGGDTLLNNQRLVGQGASDTLATITGVTVPPFSDALPSTGGTNPTITSATIGVTLGQNNTLRGLTIGDAGGGSVNAKIVGNNFGTLTVGKTGGADVTLNGQGRALSLQTGTFDATSAFSSVESTASGAHGITLISVGGTVAFGSTSVFNSASQGIFVNQSTVNVNFGNTTVGTASPNSCGGDDGVRLENNSSGTRTFGDLTIQNCPGDAFLHTGAGGLTSITGTTTITNPFAMGIIIQNAAASNGVTFGNTSVNGSGGTGVVLGGAGAGNSGAVTFADLDISPDAGQRAFLAEQNTGTITTTSGAITTSGNAGPFAISGPAGRTPLALVFDSINLSAPTNVGLNLNLVSGNMTVGTTTVSGGAGNLVGLQVLSSGAGGTMNFGNTTVTGTNSTAGVRLGIAGQGNAGAITFNDLDIAPSATHPGFVAVDNTGTITSSTGTISVTDAPAVSVTNSAALGMTLTSVSADNTGDADSCVTLTGAGGSINMQGGTLTGGTAAAFLVSGGTVSATYSGGITQASNAATVSVAGGHDNTGVAGTGTLTFQTGTLSATGGTGLQFDNADGTYNFNGTNTLAGGDAGVDILNGSGGTFNFSANTSITSPSGTAFNVGSTPGSPLITYNGTITQNTSGQRAVNIDGTAGGSIGFGGTVAGDNDHTGVNLSNAAGSVAFTTLNLGTAGARMTNQAVTITGGSGTKSLGAVSIFTTGAAQGIGATNSTGAISAASGTVNASGAAAVNIVGTSAASRTPLNIQLTTVAANGGANGVVLTNTSATGSPGGFRVLGNTSGVCGGNVTNAVNHPIGAPTVVAPNIADCTGGVIQSATATGVLLTNADTVSLTRVRVASSSDDGIGGSGVANLTLTNSLVENNGNAVGDRGIDITNLTGSGGISASTIRGNKEHNVIIINNGSGNLTAFNVANSQVATNDLTPLTGTGDDGVGSPGTELEFAL